MESFVNVKPPVNIFESIKTLFFNKFIVKRDIIRVKLVFNSSSILVFIGASEIERLDDLEKDRFHSGMLELNDWNEKLKGRSEILVEASTYN